MHSTPDDAISAEISRLQKPLAGRRWLSWVLFLALISACLLAPIAAGIWPDQFAAMHAGQYFKPPASAAEISAAKHATAPPPRAAAPTYMQLDASWNPGHVSSSHQPWANDCKVCHAQPFVRVQDKECLSCHKNTGDHVPQHTANVAELHEVRCATCHRDHQGEFGLAQQNKRYTAVACSSCHANIKASFAATKTENVSDFATGHPAFRIQTADAAGILVRQRQDHPLSESTTLKFPHDVHVAKAGVASPDGKVVLGCVACHKPNADGVGFVPVTMKKDCQSCHALKFEPAVSQREVPHGSVSQVLSTLREFYSYVSVNRVALDRRPDLVAPFQIRPGGTHTQTVASFIDAPGDARSRAVAAATDLFEKTSCVVCHQVSRVNTPGQAGTPGQDMPQWKIAPLAAAHSWMPKAAFDHSKHATAQCADCHKAASSSKADQVLMPSISDCRTCHAGNTPVPNKVRSDCGLCHGFHLPAASAASILSKTHVPALAAEKIVP
ncbi:MULTISPECIES: cytochrome c3 family protein [unclassified Undibacterium]|uniref:cytochrome c3 family protein n=1 Tax=unclassified Undibacterium TaxID=2630295 RepID=UPI002AC89B6A|nr:MULTISPECIES: cytochrome c3 family protein [unclassified Undibacterium]MEB0140067.1 cytochrome c3 family protein [Undibacterium sp. CCC2.1]MEB0173177.1 cytochrome c3 family protein [Undibacterium sp. CCC1.1]MEB0176896.1 cytochrome c3 family protein [Undibacterium sp. CCC3.4]MEB0216191.1 cytochrome c3 family protein [Undibacterium sp. 5I2]WPX41949.1 cytochrome c3 family protein [Undibacterium sp. CCC3.4]